MYVILFYEKRREENKIDTNENKSGEFTQEDLAEYRRLLGVSKGVAEFLSSKGSYDGPRNVLSTDELRGISDEYMGRTADKMRVAADVNAQKEQMKSDREK